jgi:putative ABC transport system permease protein
MFMASIWAYYVPIEIVTIIVSNLIVFIISALTIGGKVMKAARFNPVDTLRDE